MDGGAELPSSHTGKAVPPGSSKQKAGSQPAFILGDGLTPVPSKLVEKIQRREFFNMANLLRDNLEAQRRSVDQETTQSARNKKREIPNLLNWVSCFGAYTAVLPASTLKCRSSFGDTRL